jgi:hypothetical protein
MTKSQIIFELRRDLEFFRRTHNRKEVHRVIGEIRKLTGR